MRKLINKFIDSLPYVVSVILVAEIIVLLFQYGLHYNQLLGLISVLIWPGIVLSALIFFRKVFTYLFFSMEEFNFFGNRGTLKNVKDIIEEKVQQRLEADRQRQEQQHAVGKIESELNAAKVSKANSEKQAVENLNLANDIFKKYRSISQQNANLFKELSTLRKEKAEREARHAIFSERMHKRREEAARDEYIQRQIEMNQER